MIDDEERLALERELAAALAELKDDTKAEDVAAEPMVELMGLAHRDLNDILGLVMQESLAEDIPSYAELQKSNACLCETSWDLLMESVTVCERDFFGAIAAEISDIRDSILFVADDAGSNKLIVPQDIQATRLLEASSEAFDKHEVNGLSLNDLGISNDQEQESTLRNVCATEGPSEVLPQMTMNSPQFSDVVVSSKHSHAQPAAMVLLPSPIVPPILQPASNLPDPILVHLLEPKDESCVRQVESEPRTCDSTNVPAAIDSSSWFREAQQQWLKLQREASEWLTQLDCDVMSMEREQQRKDLERSESRERTSMAREEQRVLRNIEYRCEERARFDLHNEDLLSSALNEFFALEAKRDMEARIAMENEDIWSTQLHVFLKQQELQLKQMKEENKARRVFNTVLVSLIEVSRAKFAEEQKRVELLRKRETRECSLMRAEEALTRRRIAQTRALHQERDRVANRLAMAAEDDQSREIERSERLLREIERHNCHMMHEEENRTARAWSFARETEQMKAKQRLKDEEEEKRRARWLGLVAEGSRKASKMMTRHWMIYAFCHWKSQAREIQLYDKQAQRIQNWWRYCQLSMSNVQESDECSALVYDESAQDAAMVVQSAFRGFFVRRKFQAALELAREVSDGDADGVFGEINLDDLIQLPPELEEGWEDPVLPQPARRGKFAAQEVTVESHIDNDDGCEDDEEGRFEVDNSVVQARTAPTTPLHASANISNQYANAIEPMKEQQNLAAAIWGKMMRSKHKQRKAIEERVKEQDPTYRAQKLLQSSKRKSKAAHPTPTTPAMPSQPAPTISWTTSSNPPKPKVKLPSLVERLRRKTAAERG